MGSWNLDSAQTFFWQNFGKLLGIVPRFWGGTPSESRSLPRKFSEIGGGSPRNHGICQGLHLIFWETPPESQSISWEGSEFRGGGHPLESRNISEKFAEVLPKKSLSSIPGPGWARGPWSRLGLRALVQVGPSFLEKQKIIASASSGWNWDKNLGLGRLGFMNIRKFLPSGLKIQAVILTRRDLSIYGHGKYGRRLEKLIASEQKHRHIL